MVRKNHERVKLFALVSHFPFSNVNRWELARRLPRHGVDVAIFSVMSSKISPHTPDLPHNIRFIPISRGRRYLVPFVSLLAGILMSISKADGFWLIDTVFPQLTYRVMGKVPLILHLDDPRFDLPPNPIIYDKRVARIIVPTEIIKEKLINIYKIDPIKLSVVPFGVDTKLFKSSPIPRNENILYYGTFAKFRSRLLLQVMEEVVKKRRSAKFILIGKVPDWFISQLKEKMILKNVQIVGYIPHSMLPGWIEKCRVCILPQETSLGGRFPVKLIEWMACGRPIVMTNVEESWIIKNSGSGIITPIDAKSMTEAIIALLDDDRLARDLSQKGARYAERYDWEIVSERYAKIIKESLRSL